MIPVVFDYLDDMDAKSAVTEMMERWVREGYSLSPLLHAMQDAIDDDRAHQARRKASLHDS